MRGVSSYLVMEWSMDPNIKRFHSIHEFIKLGLSIISGIPTNATLIP